MAAHPKNKITRVEQGKRRAGNTPKFLVDPKTKSVALHKRGFFAKIFEFLGDAPIKGALVEEQKEKKAVKAPVQTATSGITAALQQARAKAPRQTAGIKKVTRTQHKGS